MIQAGAHVIRSSRLDWSNGLTYDVLESESGVDRAQITRDFGNKQNLVGAVIKHSLEIDESQLERYLADLEQLLGDRDRPLAEALHNAGMLDEQFIRDNRRIYAQMTLWGSAGEEEDVASLIRSFYREYDERRREITIRTVEKRLAEAGLSLRAGLSGAEIMALLTAISEGLAVRTAIDPDTMQPGSTGVVYQLIVEALIDLPALPDVDGPGRIGDRIALVGL